MQLTTCCRCCSLKTGTIFSGVCGIVSVQLFLYFHSPYVIQLLHKSASYSAGTSRDCPDPDLHSERRMENDNRRHPRQDDRKDHLRNQPLHDHPDLYTAHNRGFKGKKFSYFLCIYIYVYIYIMYILYIFYNIQ